MPAHDVILMDTSVLLNLLKAPGFAQNHSETARRYNEQADRGARFIIPITSVIEAGNHISQIKDKGGKGDTPRKQVAENFVEFLKQALTTTPPWSFHAMQWDEDLLKSLIDGVKTGSTLAQHLGVLTKTVGMGDLAILAERQRYLEDSAFAPEQVKIWALDDGLTAYGEALVD